MVYPRHVELFGLEDKRVCCDAQHLGVTGALILLSKPELTTAAQVKTCFDEGRVVRDASCSCAGTQICGMYLNKESCDPESVVIP